jgi:pSer/pThr/pTyr-binding forkhead associated (FHA) protein
MKLTLVSVDREKPPIVLDQFPVIVGIDPGADLCLDDSSLGHYQCMIDDSDGVLIVYDLGTKTGTTINDVRVVKKATLSSGDELGIGKNRFLANYDDRAIDLHTSERDASQQITGGPPSLPRRRHRSPATV